MALWVQAIITIGGIIFAVGATYGAFKKAHNGMNGMLDRIDKNVDRIESKIDKINGKVERNRDDIADNRNDIDNQKAICEERRTVLNGVKKKVNK